MVSILYVSRRRLFITIVTATTLCAIFFWIDRGSSPSSLAINLPRPLSNPLHSLPTQSPDIYIEPVARYFIDYPLNSTKYADQFGELGKRVQILRTWIAEADANENTGIQNLVEEVVTSMFPFLRNPSKPNDKTPFTTLRKSFIPGSRGIVITTGVGTFRFACHLVVTIREVHKSKLPIQIVYAGDGDLPPKNRDIMNSLVMDIEFLDILTVLDDKTLKLADSGWATKSFAALVSKFEQVILLDADSVFVQPPEVVFEQRGYRDTGAFLYHDRLLWQHNFADRHEWWHKQMEHHTPSPALLKSLVWMEDYAEEGDSGLVVLDKSRLGILTGLLHICWQNTYAVREEITYKITYGDKESWWFGFELSEVPFVFENHYGAIAGYLKVSETEKTERVCSFTIAHTDEKDKLLWYNGSLLKNKAIDATAFEVPTHWMMDATWEKGGSKPEISCMRDGKARKLTAEETKIIEQSVEVAKRVDSTKSLLSQPLGLE
jgi:alpha 1,3-mannosyltransferase